MSVVAALFMDYAAPVVTVTTWNPADKGADIVLSNSNRTAANPNATWNSVRAVTSHSTGKFYFEAVLGGDVLYARIGLNDGTGSTGTYLGGMAGAYVVVVATAASLAAGNGIALTADAYASTIGFNLGDTVAVIVDFGVGKIWLARNNDYTFYATAGATPDPAAGTRALATFTPPLALFPTCSVNDGGLHPALTLASPLTYAPPSGFSSWT